MFNNSRKQSRLTLVTGVILVVAAMKMLGCAQNPEPRQANATGDQVQTLVPRSAKTGNQLWAENCAACHNMRGPGEFGDAQWKVIVGRMSIQDNLTGEEQRKIVEFLQSAN